MENGNMCKGFRSIGINSTLAQNGNPIIKILALLSQAYAQLFEHDSQLKTATNYSACDFAGTRTVCKTNRKYDLCILFVHNLL